MVHAVHCGMLVLRTGAPRRTCSALVVGGVGSRVVAAWLTARTVPLRLTGRSGKSCAGAEGAGGAGAAKVLARVHVARAAAATARGERGHRQGVQAIRVPQGAERRQSGALSRRASHPGSVPRVPGVGQGVGRGVCAAGGGGSQVPSPGTHQTAHRGAAGTSASTPTPPAPLRLGASDVAGGRPR
jgi:hypothetical protein